MSMKDELGEAIRVRMGVTPGHILSSQSGVTTSDVSKIRRRDWAGISTDKLLVIAEKVGVKLIYSFEECEPVKPKADTVKSKFDLDKMNTEVF